MDRLVFGGGGIAEAIENAKILNREDCNVENPIMVQEAMDNYKPKTVIVTAGISYPTGIKESDPYEWQHEINVNLYGSYNVARAAAVSKVKTIIFLASIAGLYGKPNHSGYSASKAGVISLVESLAMEGYNAYAISPGRVNTPMREKDYPNDKPNTRLEPSEIAAIIVDIEAGKYKAGDNIIIRRIGTQTQPIKVDRNDKWRKELKVGQPVKL